MASRISFCSLNEPPRSDLGAGEPPPPVETRHGNASGGEQPRQSCDVVFNRCANSSRARFPSVFHLSLLQRASPPLPLISLLLKHWSGSPLGGGGCNPCSTCYYNPPPPPPPSSPSPVVRRLTAAGRFPPAAACCGYLLPPSCSPGKRSGVFVLFWSGSSAVKPGVKLMDQSPELKGGR